MITDRPGQSIDKLSRFLNTPLEACLDQRLATDPEQNVLALFRSTLDSVPAYRQFLEAAGVDPERIGNVDDFRALPLMTKAGYMQAYPLPGRCKGGSLLACDRVAVSSGSTGVPTFWPRAMVDELEVALRFEQVFRQGFQCHRRATLAVVCFPLGNWVGGIFTASCCWYLAQKGYPLTVATPGNKPDEILRVVRELGRHFEQTVLLGYPPFVKDVLDIGRAEGLDWAERRIKLVFAGEVFSEEWRALISERVGQQAPCYGSASLYGTADAGVLGNETPRSIAIRRFLAETPAAARQLFGESRLPTLVQYDPIGRFFERLEDGTLAVSADNGVPLIRYHIADRGGLMSHAGMAAFLADWGVASLAGYGLDTAEPDCRLPFVWVFGRADFTVSYYGANIYPENVIVGLEQPPVSAWVSGKFVMETRQDADGGEYLHLAVELLPSVAAEAGKAAAIAASIQTQLLRLNSEFANYVPAQRQTPMISLLPFGDAEYFPPGVKHRYTRR